MDPVQDYISQKAISLGIDPNIALRVASSEGGFNPNRAPGDQGSSFGPFQLHYGNVAPGGNSVPGLGDTFTQQTGLDARDPNSWKQQVDFALGYAKQHGWGAWHGAANTGIPNWAGIVNDNKATPNMDPTQLPAMTQAFQNPAQGVQSALDQMPQSGQGPLGKLLSDVPYGSDVKNFLGVDFGNRLQRAGAWALAANNPFGAGSMLNGVNSGMMGNLKAREMVAPTWGVVGQNEFGQPIYGWINRMNQTINGQPSMAAQGSSMLGGGGSQNPLSLATGLAPDSPVMKAIQSGKTGDDLLAQPGINPVIAQTVRGIANGSIPFNQRALIGKGAAGWEIQALLQAYEPGATMAQFEARQGGMKDWASGKSAETMRRADQALVHGGQLADNFYNLDQGQGSSTVPLFNKWKDLYQTNLGGEGSFLKARSNITAFANELGAFSRANGGTDTAAREWAENFPVDGSPQQRRAALAEGANLFQGMIDAAEQKRLAAVGPVNAARMGPVVPQKFLDNLQHMRDYANQEGAFAPKGGAAPAAPAANQQVEAAKAWLAANPNDPKAPAVAAKLKQMGVQ